MTLQYISRAIVFLPLPDDSPLYQPVSLIFGQADIFKIDFSLGHHVPDNVTDAAETRHPGQLSRPVGEVEIQL